MWVILARYYSRDLRSYNLWLETGFGTENMKPHNVIYTMIGGSLLWVGWFGFNAGSALGANGRAGMAMLATQVRSHFVVQFDFRA